MALSVLFVALPVQAAPHTGTSMITIRLISTDEEGTTLIDRKPQYKVSKGDVIRVTSDLHNQVAQLGKPKGAFVGWATMILTVVTTSQGDASLDTGLLGGGIRAQGRVRFGHLQTYTVTGGTGRFKNAVGTAEFHANPRTERRFLVYRLRLR